jgi:release factor glutamine methyltransferase
MSSEAQALLRWAAGEIPAADARLLLAHVLGDQPSRLLLAPALTTVQIDRFVDLVDRRRSGIPAQYLTGAAAFRTVELSVGPGVFIPRPETEVMTGWALDRLADLPADRTPVVVELCAGSGAISLALATERPGLRQYAVELSEEAVGFARTNLAGTDVELRSGDMADAFGELDGGVDLVIANPPYIPLEAFEGVPAEVREHEPLLALFSGDDGLTAMRVVARVAARLLRPGGLVCAEHAEVQQESAPEVFVRHGGFDLVRDHPDLTGRPRFVTARRRPTMAG